MLLVVRRYLAPALLGVLLLNACAPAAAPLPAPEAPARETPPARPRAVIRLGVLLPAASDRNLQQYSSAVLEGVRVAAAEREAEGAHQVELVIREIATAADAAAAVRALAAEGVIGVVGPLLPESLAQAAAGRSDSTLVLVSPTAAEPFTRAPNVYALNVPDTLGASALGEYAGRSAAGPVAVLRPRSGPAVAQARAFTGGYARTAGRSPLEVSYQPGTTSYADALQRIRNAGVRTIFVAAEEGDLRQLLPQIGYYGLAGAQLLATGPWATPDGLQRIGLQALDGALITLPFLESDSAGTWQHFVRGYESLYRRSLANAIPALGYDAAALLLAGATGGPAAQAQAQVARQLRTGEVVGGATGSLVPLRGSIGRRPLLVRVQDGGLRAVTRTP
jgi:ABC-type branched-subunit amino acid transport system substrate-binding protein